MTSGQWSDSRPVWPGRHWPLGATWSTEATNFAVWAPRATALWVCLFDVADQETRYRLTEHTLGTWHGAVPGLRPGQRYGFRADGPWQPEAGLVFNPAKLLLDPYALACSGEVDSDGPVYAHRAGAPSERCPRDSAPYVARSVLVVDDFDWGDDRPPGHRWRDTVVCELHVKGYTQRHPEVPEAERGTYAGLAHPAVTDYLTDLGVTAVELLPVHELVPEPRLGSRGLTNYWGYNSVGFFAPHHAYSSSGDRGQQVREFKQMVRDLHAAGLEVILDVVYNHTAEADPTGPTLCFRGLDDLGYYRRELVPTDDEGPRYWDLTGCGNTVDTEQPQALRMILDSLRYWATEMHVDGFRFDLASALIRTDGEVDMACHLLTAIGQDPVLRHLKLVAEPWDVTPEGYQVGGFPPPWVEWNDRFRDTVRDFWRGRTDGIATVATRLSGSSDLYADDGRSPYASLNFVTAHDGFTLRDLVSYDHKHNEANGEGDQDGTDDNRSWNCGVEGETDDPEVRALRLRQAANLMVTLCLSTGVPMLTAGDERGRTQRGNNNAYCQDDETSWLDWEPSGADADWLGLHRITRAALRLRRDHPALRQRHFLEGGPALEGGPKDLAWIHPEGREMADADWFDEGLHTFGMFVSGDPLRAPGPRGEQIRDASFLLWFHAHPGPGKARLPDNAWVHHGEVVLSTDPDHPVGEHVDAGDVLDIAPRSVIVLRERAPVSGGR